jgi:pentatricopeptide repeat protein
MNLHSQCALVLLVVHASGVAAQKSSAQELTMMGQASSSQDMQEFEPLELARLGIDYMRQRAIKEAGNCFSHVLQSHDMAAKSKVGRYYFKQQDYATATVYFQQSGSGFYAGYDVACAWSNLGATYIKLNNLPQARECLERSTMLFEGLANKDDVDIKQDALLATFNLGLVHWQMGNHYESWECWASVAEHSYCVQSLQIIAKILLKSGKFDDAVRVLERMHKMKEVPTDVSADVANNLGVIAYKKSQVEQARQYFIRASELGHSAAQKNLKKLQSQTVAKGPCTIL